MKRRDEREGALDAKPCDWQAAKGSWVFPLRTQTGSALRDSGHKAVLGKIPDYAF